MSIFLSGGGRLSLCHRVVGEGRKDPSLPFSFKGTKTFYLQQVSAVFFLCAVFFLFY